MGYLKGKSTLMVFDKHPQMRTKWDRSFWARGYYVTTVGSVNQETIKKYIIEQQKESYKEERTSK
jgi:putative transposase